MTTSRADHAIGSGPPVRELSALQASELAKISYRQLDHWARQGWVTPTVDKGAGRSGRRVYSPDDVVRLDLLRHLAVSGVSPTVAGPAVAKLTVAPDRRVVWGPVGVKETTPSLTVVGADEILATVQAGGAHVVYSPEGVLGRLGRLSISGAEPAAVDDRSARKRRSA